MEDKRVNDGQLNEIEKDGDGESVVVEELFIG